MSFSKLCLCGLFLLQTIAVHAQSVPDSSRNPATASWGSDEQPPEFPGGPKALTEYLRRNVRYPETAKQAGIKGRVFASFVINTVGAISRIRVLKGLGYGCDEEAVRIVETMPRWKPGKLNGRTVSVMYNLPVLFGVDYPQAKGH